MSDSTSESNYRVISAKVKDYQSRDHGLTTIPKSSEALGHSSAHTA
ncbi:hypothetical protein [Nostoc sp.]